MDEDQILSQAPARSLPDLHLSLPDGQPITLSECRGKRHLVALFSGGAECPTCRSAIMKNLCTRTEEYERAGATALLVLHCSPVEAELVRRRDGLTLPVLVDPAGEACRLVGAHTPDGAPATALIVTDCAGRIYLETRPDENIMLPTRDAVFECLRGMPDPACAG